MYRVLIVDDEPWVVKGLAEGIPWEELGLELLAQTTDSQEALSIILNRPVDIVITDIQMPNLSGLDLMRCSREQGQDCDFIIFSGYSDFEYAKRAIQYGVFAYLLKPLVQKELLRALTLLVRNIQSKKYALREQSEAFFLDGRLRVDLTRFEGEQASFCVLTAYFTFLDQLLLAKELDGLDVSEYRLGSNRYVYLVKSSPDAVRKCLERLLRAEDGGEKEYLSFGVSSAFRRAEEFETALWKSNVAAHSHFLFPEKRISGFTDSDIACCNQFLQEVFAALGARDLKRAAGLVEEELVGYCREHVLTIQDFSYLYNRILAWLEENRAQEAPAGYEALSYDQLPLKYASATDAACFLGQAIREDLSTPEKPAADEPFQHILDYIDGNYSEDISLSDLSARFYVNMTYICDLFQKHQGTTFSKYLTNLRLEKACRMIRETPLTLAEITEAVGYRDYYYFIKQFKKKYGVTPGQFRKDKLLPENRG